MTDLHERIAALVAAYEGDALFRPSSADRLMGCPGSIQLGAQAPRERRSSRYAQEGTAAHKVAEQHLTGVRAVDEWTDRMVRLDDEGLEGVFVDEAMVTGLGMYIDEIERDMAPGTQAFTEAKLSLGTLDPDDPLLAQNRGTVDRVHLHYESRKVRTFDLKWGQGVMVSATTPQLRNYSLMAIVSYAVEGGWREVENTVVQPRASDPGQRVKTVTYDPNYLLDSFLGEMYGAMNAAMDPNPPLNPGTWCRWCRAKPLCPALRRQALDLASLAQPQQAHAGDMLGPLPESVFIGTAEEPKPRMMAPGQVVLPAATALDPGHIAVVLSRRHLWDAWIQSVEHQAVALLEQGVDVPGWALDRRSGHRRWKDPDSVQPALTEAGVSIGHMYTEPKLKSPAQIEKLLPPERRGIVAGMVERPLGDVILVKADQRRKTEIPVALGPIEKDQG